MVGGDRRREKNREGKGRALLCAACVELVEVGSDVKWNGKWDGVEWIVTK